MKTKIPINQCKTENHFHFHSTVWSGI